MTMRELSKEHSLEKMRQIFRVSRSGYYYFLNNPFSKRSLENQRLLFLIKTEYERSRCTYGAFRITAVLKQKGILCSRQRVARIMRENGIASKIRKSFKKTAHSNYNKEIAPNLLEQNFAVSGPNTIWTSDITYIKTREGWLYATSVMVAEQFDKLTVTLSRSIDLFNREILSIHTSKTMHAENTSISALKEAYLRRKPNNPLIFHSDKGSKIYKQRI